MNKKLMKCLTGVPNSDVPELCMALGQIAKAVNPDITPEAYMKAFGDFWASCFAFPGKPPVKGVRFMQQVFPDGTPIL